MRQSEFPILPMFLERWSPRSFTGESVSTETLMTAFEAARWAPSSGNSQPWRFVFAKKGSAQWDQFLGFLVEGNQVWAKSASALIVVISKKDTEWNGKVVPAPCHSFDAGASWMSMALQLLKMGWMTHGMAGIEHEKIRRELSLPENYHIEAMIAVGKIADKAQLPAALQERESPNDRKPLSSMVSEGVFKF